MSTLRKVGAEINVPDVGRNVVPDTWTADGEGMLPALNLGPNFQNFLGRSLEDFFSKESMQIFETFLENVFGRI